jgi:hypothetical protein
MYGCYFEHSIFKARHTIKKKKVRITDNVQGTYKNIQFSEKHTSSLCCIWSHPEEGHAIIQGISKRFEQFRFGNFYLLTIKIRYNFTHK